MSTRGTKNVTRAHVLIFVAHNGPGPYPCSFCEQPVEMLDGLAVHHLDHDHGNNDPSNLAATHRGCHTTHHQSIRWRSPEERAKQSAHRKGKKHPADCGHCSAIRGKRRPDVTERQKGKARPDISKALKGKARPDISERQRGKPRPDVSAALKGRQRPDISARLKGKSRSPEVRAAISAGHKRRAEAQRVV